MSSLSTARCHRVVVERKGLVGSACLSLASPSFFLVDLPRMWQALEGATSALMVYPRHVPLRAKTMFLIHGLIPCLGEGLLRGLSVNALLVLVQEGEGKDLMEVRPCSASVAA